MRVTTILVLAVLLAGCGGRGADALAVCEDAIAERLTGKNYRLDAKALLASAREEGENVLVLTGEVVIEPGMTHEQKQTVECKARFAPGQSRLDVISLNFVW